MSTTTLPLASIRCDGGTQPREKIDEAVVAEYAERLNEGDEFPPVTVFYDGTDYWLADGFHRVAAHDEAGRSEVPADVRQGTVRDAVWHSVGANRNHGLRRTSADKRRSITVILMDEEWARLSDREIARAAGVHHSTVGAVRSDLVGRGEISHAETRTDTLGREQPASKPAPSVPRDWNEDGAKQLSRADEARRQRESQVGKDYTAVFVALDDDSPAPPPPARAVIHHTPYSARMKALVSAAVDASTVTDEEIAGIPANDMMIHALRTTRDVLDRIIAHHTKGRKHG